MLKEHNITTIVLDHHEADYDSQDAIVINSQFNNYPNNQLSGVGVTWQFCRYLDTLLDKNYANSYLDLVALGLTADMQSLKSLETKHLINKGFEPENIKNPFIYFIWQKNQFKLGKHITSWGAAFYIAPFVNAIVRSGTLEEKELIFESMLKFKAFEMIPSNKRGHKLGEEEQRVEQAMRTCTNVKNRQTRAQDAGMEFLENKIVEDNMLDHQVLLFLIEPGQVDRNIAG
jgi:single-stranded-DNA-specific exonuclease